MRWIPLSIIALAMGSQTGWAQDLRREGLGTARLLTNDVLGDADDRWRTGAYQLGALRGPKSIDGLPEAFGHLLEYRFRMELVTPENLTNPAPDDREYAGLLSFGLHSHQQYGPLEWSLGTDLVFIGPQTRVGEFQEALHKLVDGPDPDLDNQIGDDAYVSALGALASRIPLTDDALLRPYLEAQWGHETYVRAGVDLIMGPIGVGGMFTRDVVTGTPLRATRGQAVGTSFILGGDIAYLHDSRLFPDDGVAPENLRTRLRVGGQYRGETNRIFYGLTWLSEEFEGQPEAQVVGSFTVSFEF